MRSAPFLAQIPNLPTKARLEGARSRKSANAQIPNPQAATPQSAPILCYWRARAQFVNVEAASSRRRCESWSCRNP
eukprot:11100914-Alexandrium_andersonii.AAC.1